MVQMTQTLTPPASLAVNLRALELSEAQFERVAADNPELRLELTAEGELIVMPPTGGRTGHRNLRIGYRLQGWSENPGDGIDGGLAFDSSTCFTLPNGAKRSPDAAWVTSERWAALSEREQESFPPLCPDFVLELRSPTDSLKVLEAKLGEYITGGARLGWLLDPQTRRVHIYRPGQAAEVLENPDVVNGEDVLQGFELKVLEVWS